MSENGWTIATYAAHNEALRAAEAELRKEHEARIDERFAARDKELALQAGKDKEHLENLNHEQARLLADRERYLPRETYAADRKDKQAFWMAVISIAVAIMALIAVLPKWSG